MKREITDLRTLLSEPLDHQNGEKLKSQLTQCEAWSAFLAERAGEYKKILAERRGQHTYKDPLGKDTEPIVRARADRAVATEQQQYESYADLVEIVRTRITLGQSLLRTLRTEIEGGLRG